MKIIIRLVACLGWLVISAPSALALNHLQSNRIYLFNPGQCSRPTGPLWITIGTGQAAPGAINVTAPGFDQIAALVTGNVPPETEDELRTQAQPCDVIASFYEAGTPIGAWVVPIGKLYELISILKLDG